MISKTSSLINLQQKKIKHYMQGLVQFYHNDRQLFFALDPTISAMSLPVYISYFLISHKRAFSFHLNTFLKYVNILFLKSQQIYTLKTFSHSNKTNKKAYDFLGFRVSI